MLLVGIELHRAVAVVILIQRHEEAVHYPVFPVLLHCRHWSVAEIRLHNLHANGIAQIASALLAGLTVHHVYELHNAFSLLIANLHTRLTTYLQTFPYVNTAHYREEGVNSIFPQNASQVIAPLQYVEHGVWGVYAQASPGEPVYILAQKDACRPPKTEVESVLMHRNRLFVGKQVVYIQYVILRIFHSVIFCILHKFVCAKI